MNRVELIGRLTRDPVVRYTSGEQMAVASFTLAVDRPGKDKNGNKQADFPRVTAFGKTAETIEKYVKKGTAIAVEGRIQTGSYDDKNGNKVYTTDVIADRVEFLPANEKRQPERQTEVPQDFEAVDEDVPF